MEKIVTHPLYIRCKKVVESCETKEHIEIALNYVKLIYRKLKKELSATNDEDKMEEILTLLLYLDILEYEMGVEWN